MIHILKHGKEYLYQKAINLSSITIPQISWFCEVAMETANLSYFISNMAQTGCLSHLQSAMCLLFFFLLNNCYLKLAYQLFGVRLH